MQCIPKINIPGQSIQNLRAQTGHSLPEQLRQLVITFGHFKHSLKTFMLWLVGPQHLVSEH